MTINNKIRVRVRVIGSRYLGFRVKNRVRVLGLELGLQLEFRVRVLKQLELGF